MKSELKKNIIRVLIEANKIIGNLTEYETGIWYEKEWFIDWGNWERTY